MLASTRKIREIFPPIGSVPLIPIVDVLNALGARVHRDDLFIFSIRYEAPGALRGSSGAPWFCQPPPASIVP
jgi:hypothetical protein